MGEEVRINNNNNNNNNYNMETATTTNGDDDIDNNERVHEWELGLPTGDDLTPLSQLLVPPELSTAFSISPEPPRTLQDVNRASRDTFSSLCGGDGGAYTHALDFKSFYENQSGVIEAEDNNNNNNNNDDDDDKDRDGSDLQSRKLRKLATDNGNGAAETADADSSAAAAGTGGDARMSKRPRLVWTPQLHKRFVDVVAHLGIKNAVPKTIMQLMNVEGLTRENVASHLQKYRLYLKRMQGGVGSDTGGASNSEQQLFDSFNEGGGGGGGSAATGGGSVGGGANSNGQMAIPVPYQMMHMPVQMPVYGHHHHPMGLQIGDPHGQYQHNGFEGANPYSMMQQSSRDWSGSNCRSVASYPRHVAPNDNN
ncbi:hypothetical protein ACFE04_011604 [Oxalis oulophora]